MNLIKNIVILLLLSTILNITSAQIITKSNSYKDMLYNSKYKEAINLIKDEIQKNPDEYVLYYDCGNAYKSLFQFDSAIIYLEKAVELNNNKIEILHSLGYCYTYYGMFENAVNAYKKILLITKNDILAMNKLAAVYIELNQLKLANQLYKSIIKVDSKNSYYYKQSGFCYLKMDSTDNAMKMYNYAYELNKKDIETIVRLGKLIYSTKNLEAAYQILRAGYELYPKNVQINSVLADVCFEKKDYVETIVHLDRSIAGGDSSAMAYQKLGVTYYFLANSEFVNNIKEEERKFKSALYALEKSYEKDSNNALTVLYLGTTYKELKNYDQAIFYLNKAIDLMTSNYISDTYIHLGSAYELSNNCNDAIVAYNNSLKFNQENINALFYIAGIYDKNLKNRKVAIEFYEKYLSAYKGQNPIMENYASERIQKLRQELHFRGEL